MYSYEERKKAVELYIQYGYRAAAVIRELGYPDRHTLKRWAREYEEDRDLHQRYRCAGKYSKEQKEAALKHYAEHGRCAAQTTKALGYPSPTVFRRWLNETFPDREKRCVSGKAMVEYPQKEKKQAVIDLCARQGSAQEVAAAHGASRVSLYKWKKQLLGEERCSAMPKRKNPATKDVAALEKRIEDLQAQEAALAEKLYRAQLEYDILEKAAELLKKAQGVNLKAINNREKAEVIDALKAEARMNELDVVFRKLYEDNALGRISEEQFAFLTSGYGEERKSLSERIVELKKEINTVAERGADVKRFLDIVHRYTEINELTYENVHELIDRILIHELDKEHNTRKIEIFYSFVGKVDSGEKPVESVSYFRQIGADVTSIAM